jgi:hypothetical protein
MSVNVRIELVDVYCDNTEDVTGADEFYLVGVAKADGAEPKPILTTPIDINDGQRRTFASSEITMFEGALPEEGLVALYVQAYDEDAAKDWAKRPDYVDKMLGSVVSGAGGVVVAALATNPVGWATIAAAVGVGLVVGGFAFVVGQDRDDQLGTLQTLVPASGPAMEDKYWSFSQAGWWSGWSYTVRYRVSRKTSTVTTTGKEKEKEKEKDKELKDNKETIRKEGLREGPNFRVRIEEERLARLVAPDGGQQAQRASQRAFIRQHERPAVGTAAVAGQDSEG